MNHCIEIECPTCGCAFCVRCEGGWCPRCRTEIPDVEIALLLWNKIVKTGKSSDPDKPLNP